MSWTNLQCYHVVSYAVLLGKKIKFEGNVFDLFLSFTFFATRLLHLQKVQKSNCNGFLPITTHGDFVKLPLSISPIPVSTYNILLNFVCVSLCILGRREQKCLIHHFSQTCFPVIVFKRKSICLGQNVNVKQLIVPSKYRP